MSTGDEARRSIIEVLSKYPNSSAVDVSRHLTLTRGAIQGHLRYLNVRKEIYVSGWKPSYENNAIQVRCYSIGNLPSAVVKNEIFDDSKLDKEKQFVDFVQDSKFIDSVFQKCFKK